MGKSLRSLKEHIKVNRPSEQASKYPTRLDQAKTRLSLLVTSASATRMKTRSKSSATTKNPADGPPEDSAVKDSQKELTTNSDSNVSVG